MKDQLGRSINYLRISVTDLCNYRCIYCMEEGGVCKRSHEDMLSLENMVEITEAAVSCGIRKIRLTGGEPLVRKGIVHLVEQLRAIKGVEELTMTTNGSLLKEFASDLKKAGLDRLNISLDTLSPERFAQITRTGSLEQVMAGLEAAKAAGFEKTKINVVLLGGLNTDEISDFAELTRKEALSVRFIELMPMGVVTYWPRERFVSDGLVLEAVPELELVGTDGVSRLYRLPDGRGTVGLIRPMSHRFCDRCNRLRLTSDGLLRPCLHSDLTVDLRGLHGEALQSAVQKAILNKPRDHSLAETFRSGSKKKMNEIGG